MWLVYVTVYVEVGQTCMYVSHWNWLRDVACRKAVSASAELIIHQNLPIIQIFYSKNFSLLFKSHSPIIQEPFPYYSKKEQQMNENQ